MSYTDWIGSIGVFLILFAYFLNTTGKITTKSTAYLILNLLGATLACIASILLNYWPFIILEAAWVIVTLASFIRKDYQD